MNTADPAKPVESPQYMKIFTMPCFRLSLLALAALLLGSEALAQPAKDSAGPSAGPLPGQIVIDPEHPQWLKRHGGKHVFICGPGDPEDFLYLGRCKADGTRDGDQIERIKKLAEHGGNCIYMQIVRSHGGDAKKNGDPEWMQQNPFVDGDAARGLDEDILKQWEEWFTLLDRHEILIYLYFYDDSARIWDTGDIVGPEEKAFLETIVSRFKHHKNLIWIVGEESEEKYTTARVQAIAEVIKKADDYGHLIGDHHLSGTTFKAWQPGGALNHFAMQLGKTGEGAHAGAIEALAKAAGRYQIIYAENTATPENVQEWRRYAWSISMTGMMPMLMRMDIASTPVEMLQQFHHLQKFFEATDFWTMSSHDELKHEGTNYVLADPGRSYIAYANGPATRLGIKDLPAGRYAITWLDCQTGATLSSEEKIGQPGDHAFAKPQSIGAECAIAIRLAASETIVIDDPLQGRTKGKQVGGAFGSQGYQPGLGQNHILYQLPQTAREGYVEFEVKGMDAAAVPTENDHGFLGMYDGRGVTEPAQYFRDLKSNFYRWNIQWRGDRKVLKGVISCAAPTGERRAATTAQYGDKRDWTSEPNGKPAHWNPADWYRFRVEWQDKVFRLLVNGDEKWRTEGPHDYAPVKHCIWLGCAPGRETKYQSAVKDIIYRNFKVGAFASAGPKPAARAAGGLNEAPVADSKQIAAAAGTTVLFRDDFESGLGKPWTFPRTAELWTKDWISHSPSQGKNGLSGVRLRSTINRPVHAVIGDFAAPSLLNEKQRLIVEADVQVEPENQLKVGLFVKGHYFLPPRKVGDEEPAFCVNGYAFVITPPGVTSLAHNVWLIRKCEEGGLHAKCGRGDKDQGDRYVAGATHKVEAGQWYRLRVEVEGLEFAASIDGKKVIEYSESSNFYARDHHHVALYVHRNNHKPAEDDYEGDIYDKSHIGSGIFDNVVVAAAPAKAATGAKEPAGAKVSPTANRAPVAADKKITAPAGKETIIQLVFEDDDGPGPYTYTLIRAPANGTLEGDDNDRFYTPKLGFTGNDEFTWKVNDGKTDSKVATVAIRIAAPRDDATACENSPTLYFPPAGESLDKQDRRQPHEVGLKPEVIERLKKQPTGALWALWRHGRLIHVEGDFNKPVEVKSLRKTWHALTVGAAIQQGKIPSLEQKLSAWNKELTGKHADATWRHVITQASGFDYPYGEQPAYKPGEIWTYSDKNPHQLCNALARAYGKQGYHDNYQDVIGPAYFDAIGMKGWKTSIREDGIRFHFDLEDLGRLGLLVLARGQWNGKQIVARDFVEALESKQTRDIKANYQGPDDGGSASGWLREHHEQSRECPYGYMTWVNTDGDLFPDTDRAWAQGSGAGGTAVLWNHKNGIVFAGLGVDTRRGTGGIPHDIEACIAGPNPLAMK